MTAPTPEPLTDTERELMLSAFLRDSNETWAPTCARVWSEADEIKRAAYAAGRADADRAWRAKVEWQLERYEAAADSARRRVQRSRSPRAYEAAGKWQHKADALRALLAEDGPS